MKRVVRAGSLMIVAAQLVAASAISSAPADAVIGTHRVYTHYRAERPSHHIAVHRRSVQRSAPRTARPVGFVSGYKFEENGARILNAYSGFFFYATGVTPAMDCKIVGEGSRRHGDPARSSAKPDHQYPRVG